MFIYHKIFYLYQSCIIQGFIGVMVFNTTVNHISVILGQSDLLVEETGVLGEKPLTYVQVTDKLYAMMFYQVHLA